MKIGVSMKRMMKYTSLAYICQIGSLLQLAALSTEFCIKGQRAIAYNVSHVCDVAPSPTRARGRCGGAARCSAAEPEAPSWAPMHIRAVMRSCANALLKLGYNADLLLLVIGATRPDDFYELLSIDFKIQCRHIKRRLI